jgi:hypothetical protein
MVSDDEDQESSFGIHEVLLGKRKSAKGLSQRYAIQDSGLELFVRAVKIQHPDPNLKPRYQVFVTNKVSQEFERAIVSNLLLSKCVREKGKKPDHPDLLVTMILKDGSVMFKRSIFRDFITIISDDKDIMASLGEVTRRMFERASNMMKNLDRKKGKPQDIIQKELAADPLNLLIRLAYSYNRSALELFFYNVDLARLFFDHVPILLQRPYEPSE